jgi:hypothetical protein
LKPLTPSFRRDGKRFASDLVLVSAGRHGAQRDEEATGLTAVSANVAAPGPGAMSTNREGEV